MAHFRSAALTGVPAAAIEALAEQLGLLPLALEASLRSYPANEDTRLDHHERIRRHLGFIRCGPVERRRLLDNMVAVAARNDDRPDAQSRAVSGAD